MTTAEVQTLLAAAGVACRVKGDEVLVQTCPYCGNERWNLEINPARGLANCWSCRATEGRADAVLRRLTGAELTLAVSPRAGPGKPPSVVRPRPLRSVAVDAVPSAAAYLARRGLDPLLLSGYGVGVCMDEADPLYGRIVIPVHEYWKGRHLGWVGRSYTGRRPKYLSTVERQSITGWRAADRAAPCVLVEGHLDGIVVHAAGFGAAVLGGVEGAVLEFAARLAVPLILMLDGDAAVRTRALYWQIAAVRPPHVAWLAPDADPASLGVEGVRAAVASALCGQGVTS